MSTDRRPKKRKRKNPLFTPVKNKKDGAELILCPSILSPETTKALTNLVMCLLEDDARKRQQEQEFGK